MMAPSSSAKILVGLCLNAELSTELLSWAITVAASPNDSVVALHVLAKEEKKVDRVAAYKTRLRRAKAFVISMLGEFSQLCQSKQVNLEAKVCCSSSIGKGLVVEAASLEAAFLLLGGSRNRSQRPSLGITKYCFQHAPEGCSMIAIRKAAALSHQDMDVDSRPYQGLHRVRSNRDNIIHTRKALSHRQNLFIAKANSSDSSCQKKKERKDEQSPTQSITSDHQPLPTKVEEEYLALGNESQTKRSSMWKHLSPIKLLFPFFQSAFEGSRKPKEDTSVPDGENPKPSWRCFSYEEISQATNNFHPENMVGKGGYAEVFRGYLCHGQTIAVKRLAKDNRDENKEKEFLTELGIIGHVCHPNTAFLIGCCIENGLHLIFDFSLHGSLASVLHGSKSGLLEWPVRYKIIVGVAKGLHYLHKCCKHRIIHRDIKASNVLLGPKFEPQISDFGLAKWLPRQWTHHSVTPIEGTFGYLAPEYFMHGIVDEKTDVFAFGVLVLEIITGRRPVDSSKQNLLLWAKPFIESGNVTELADQRLRGRYDIDQMKRMVLTASYCIRQSSIWRPTMSEVLQFITDGNNCKAAMSWRMPDTDEVDDYITEVDYQFPVIHHLQDDQ